MFVPLPTLDDRRWTDLVDEGRSLIPVYAPGWTDHNAHDPGITILELLAWITETAIYRADRVPDQHVRAFLHMIGISVEAAAAAEALVCFSLRAEESELRLPAGTELAATLIGGDRGVFELTSGLSVLPTDLVVVQVRAGQAFLNVTESWSRQKPFAMFGDNPLTNDALYLGFDRPIRAGSTLRLELLLSGETGAPGGGDRHHSAELVWEAQVAPDVWAPLGARDHTRAGSRSGSVFLTFASDTSAARAGKVDRPLHYVRARLGAGALDAAPMVSRLWPNAGRVLQVAEAHDAWPIRRGVVAIGTPPPLGEFALLSLDVEDSAITALQFCDDPQNTLRARILAYRPATDTYDGQIVLETIRLGSGTGAPHQTLSLPGPWVSSDGVEIFTLEAGSVLAWTRRQTSNGLGPSERGFVLDEATGAVRFGDGENGRVPPRETTIVAVVRSTAGAAGNVTAGAIRELAPSARNAALLGKVADVAQRLYIGNPDAAAGGAAPETLAHAEGRALESVERPYRAVTLTDCELLALTTPGTSIARAAARANCVPSLDCYEAPGIITVVVVPRLPKGRPTPSPGLLQTVAEHLEQCRILGTRIVVTGPEYVEIAVQAQARAFAGQSASVVRQRIVEALDAFLDPLTGGPEGTGWPLGRDVYVSEILQTISAVPGVDYVPSVQITVPGCEASCEDVCLRPLALVVAGVHQIDVSLTP